MPVNLPEQKFKPVPGPCFAAKSTSSFSDIPNSARCSVKMHNLFTSDKFMKQSSKWEASGFLVFVSSPVTLLGSEYTVQIMHPFEFITLLIIPCICICEATMVATAMHHNKRIKNCFSCSIARSKIKTPSSTTHTTDIIGKIRKKLV